MGEIFGLKNITMPNLHNTANRGVEEGIYRGLNTLAMNQRGCSPPACSRPLRSETLYKQHKVIRKYHIFDFPCNILMENLEFTKFKL